MNPFLINPLFGAAPFIPARRRTRIPTLDQHGIYELCTTGIEEVTTGDSFAVNYGVNPCVWNALPCECVVVWKVRHPVSTAGAALPVNVVVPTKGGGSTVSGSSNSSSTGSKVPVLDNKSSQVAGSDVTSPVGTGSSIQRYYTTEHWVYINKSAGTFRLMGVTTQGSSANANSGSNTPAESSVKSK